MDLERFTYPAYEEPLLSAYEGRFECAYAVLHRAETGTRVPRNTQAPLTRSACLSTTPQVVQSSMPCSLD